MRVKAALFIILIIVIFTAASFFSNLSFSWQNITETMEQDLALAKDIADQLVSVKIRLLKSDADIVAERLMKTGSIDELIDVMTVQLDEFPNFIALTVYDRDKIVANAGDPLHDDIMLTEGHYLDKAFNGEKIISTTHYNSVSGAFIMHVYVPMGTEQVLSATIPGTLFADRIAEFTLWQSGGLFIIDEEGTLIAARRYDLVTDRRNFIEEAKLNLQGREIGDFFQKMISTDTGSGSYPFEGVMRMCSYKRITDSTAGWRIGVLVPLRESPSTAIKKDLLVSSIVFIIAGIFISILLSEFAAQPFYKIEAQNRRLEELKETAQAASEAKTKFLATMSHEMRTPLNAVIGLSELTLQAGGLNREAEENIDKVHNAGASLLNMINDILNISKIEAGKLELIQVEYDTPSVINDAITQSIMRRGEKPIEFILNIDENIPSRLYGDDLRIKEILNNLLSNAFKYTKDGTVELNIKGDISDPNSGQSGDTVWITAFVKDTGMGIRAENINSLFTDYTQMDVQANRKIEGTGLGLSITKKIIDMMEGTISVESEYGKGSVFTVRFPQKIINAVPIGQDVVDNLKNFRFIDNKRDIDLRMSRISLPYAKVLVVDDVATNLDVARGMMKPYRMQVDCVSSGQQAIDAVRDAKIRYNAIFMDHMMPEMDGIEATRIIREEIGTDYAKTVPIIALTANAIMGNEEMFLKHGFQDFVSKPIEIRRLDTAINRWVRDPELEKAIAEQAARDNRDFADKRSGRDRRSGISDRRSGYDRRVFIEKIEGVDINRGLARFSGDMKSYIDILRSFTSNTKPVLETLKIVDESNVEKYTIEVHGIKSSCRSIGADAAGAKAEALEHAGKAGNLNFITENNPVFLETVLKLISCIEDALEVTTNDRDSKPKKDKPDAKLLAKLMNACKNYNTGDIDEIMQEIESFAYESDDGLAQWLHDNVAQMNYSEIAEKLEKMF